MSPAQCSCGKLLDNPDEIGEHETECTGTIEMNPTETETMTDETSDTAEKSRIKNELTMIMPGSDPLANLEVKRTGLNEYQVLSARNGTVTLHTVELSAASCSCDDWQYNTDDDREICAHFAAAFIDAQDVDNGEMLMSEMGSMMNAAVELREAAQQAEQVFQGATVEARAQQADAAAETTESTPAESKDRRSDDPVVRCEEWLDELGIDTDECSIELHEKWGSINISPDGKVEWWQDLTQALDDYDDSWWDSDDRIWIIKESDFGEVFGR